jgi:hypothetical protein
MLTKQTKQTKFFSRSDGISDSDFNFALNGNHAICWLGPDAYESDYCPTQQNFILVIEIELW